MAVSASALWPKIRDADWLNVITPLIIHNGVIYIAGMGAHSHDKAEFPKDITNHTKHVMEQVKSVLKPAAAPWTPSCSSRSFLPGSTITTA